MGGRAVSIKKEGGTLLRAPSFASFKDYSSPFFGAVGTIAPVPVPPSFSSLESPQPFSNSSGAENSFVTRRHGKR